MAMASAIMANAAELTAKENAGVDIGAAVARGEQDKLGAAFKSGFDAGLTLNEAKELVGQLYAYCGFPRALNAAATLMKIEGYGLTRRRGEAESAENENGGKIRNGGSFVLGDKALEIGTANQTKLCGGPVKGALFDFHPQLDAYLKAHLFGDIFARDILDWRTREIVTIAALAARPETEPQMKAHIAIGKVNGVTDAQAAEIVRRVQLPRDPADLPRDWSPIPVGEPNTAYAKYFIGNSYLHKLTLDQVPALQAHARPGAGVRRDVRAGVPQQLAHPPCEDGWRADAHRDGGRGLLSGMGQAGASAEERRYGEHPSERQALAWCGA